MSNPDKDKIEQIIKNRKIAHTFYSEKQIVAPYQYDLRCD